MLRARAMEGWQAFTAVGCSTGPHAAASRRSATLSRLPSSTVCNMGAEQLQPVSGQHLPAAAGLCRLIYHAAGAVRLSVAHAMLSPAGSLSLKA